MVQFNGYNLWNNSKDITCEDMPAKSGPGRNKRFGTSTHWVDAGRLHCCLKEIKLWPQPSKFGSFASEFKPQILGEFVPLDRPSGDPTFIIIFDSRERGEHRKE